MSVVGLFAGIGGIELGLHRAGHAPVLLCEVDPGARAVLETRFDVEVSADITKLRALPKCDLVAAGFPCQDLSQAGRLAGIRGVNSALVDQVFRLVGRRRSGPEWVLLENVPFMLQLDRGRAMRHVTHRLAELGYNWAYRIIDTRAFGIPQRRRRVILLASRKHDPRIPLFHGDHLEPQWPLDDHGACGFYWTEGNTGLGWAVDAIPTLKGGSGLAIPSPPAVWRSDGFIGIPDVRDGERLQGFPVNWSKPAAQVDTRGTRSRWRLIGNAVSVPVAKWVGRRLLADCAEEVEFVRLSSGARWPTAAWGDRRGNNFGCTMSTWPVAWKYRDLASFLRFPLQPLSARATEGFLSRITASSLRYPERFRNDLTRHHEMIVAMHET